MHECIQCLNFCFKKIQIYCHSCYEFFSFHAKPAITSAIWAFYLLKLTNNSFKEIKVTISIVILVSKSLWFKKPLTLWLSCCKIVSLSSKPMVLQFIWNLIGVYFLGFYKNDIWIFLLVFSFALIGVILIGLKIIVIIMIIIIIIIIRFFKKNKLYNITNYINYKNSNHCVNNDFANTFLAAQMWSMTLAGSAEF